MKKSKFTEQQIAFALPGPGQPKRATIYWLVSTWNPYVGAAPKVFQSGRVVTLAARDGISGGGLNPMLEPHFGIYVSSDQPL